MKPVNVIVDKPPFFGMPAKWEKFATEDKLFFKLSLRRVDG
jgi:hypothetical protein